MASHPFSMPAFGQADLSNCEREQIHLAGSIQPHGALLVVRDGDHVVVQASANAASFLDLAPVPGVVGQPLDTIASDLKASIEPLLDAPLRGIPTAVRCKVGRAGLVFDGLVHRLPEGALIIELERAGLRVDLSRHLEGAVRRIVAAASLQSLCDETASIFQDLTGYDRVMVYRFDDEGHGEVFSECRKPELEAYLGNRYPASDIPQIARRLYERNRVRVLVDVEYEPVPLIPRLSPITGQDLDMSLCFLRSMSPIHVQYLKNMGVCATLVASLMVGGRLWGLIACHHYVPRTAHFEIRTVAELLAEAVATRVAALESFVQAQSELMLRRLEQRMVEAIARDGDWRMALFDSAQSLIQPLDASGAALLFEGQVHSTGDVPATQDIRDIGTWLDRQPPGPTVATASLGIDEPRFAPLVPIASGVLAARIGAVSGEYLLWFRPQRVRTVTWGGDPYKAVIVGNDPSELSPRRSFAQWHQLVEGTSDPWTPADFAAARMIGEIVSDVAFQFRSVRMLIAQDQLEQVSRHVRSSAQSVIITDAKGRILLTNEAFQKLLRAVHPHLQWLDDLPPLFADAVEVRRNLRALLQTMQPWRGEALLLKELGDTKPLLVRADPVFAAPDRALGFVLLFTDLSERKAAEAARRRFQEGILEHHPVTLRRDSKADLVYQNALASVVENAQLAALEITYGIDTSRMPEMLESVRASVTRTAEVLEHLIWHASHAAEDRPE